MSTRMDGIHQPSLFSQNSLRMDVIVSKTNRYRILAEGLPWLRIADVANEHRAKHVDLNVGRALNLRLHLGAFIAQGMNRWTDRETEEMVTLNAGVRLLCGLEESRDTIDHTSIETFRNQLGAEGAAELNGIVVQVAKEAGFTDGKLCSSDTTVQEAPICYPTEVGHLKKIAEKLVGIGSRIRRSITGKLEELSGNAQKLFTQIRLFTRGSSGQAIKQKKKLGKKLRKTVSKMQKLLQAEIDQLAPQVQKKYQASLDLYQKMILQIRQWMKTGVHPSGKIVSLWLTDVRAITRNKAGKMTEFGRRWIITRLSRGYIIGKECKRLGSGSDTGLMPEILEHFEKTMNELPKKMVYDRGGDGPINHRTLKEKGIVNCIFRKGDVSLPGLGRNTVLKARRERALAEATIATIKNPRYGFNKPRAKSSESCILKGQTAILGANLMHLVRDMTLAMS